MSNRKRKADPQFEASSFHSKYSKVERVRTLPLIWFNGKRPATFEEEKDKKIKPNIAFEYISHWESQLPMCLIGDMVNIIFDYIACHDLVLNRSNNEIYQCAVCGDTTKPKETKNYDVACWRCLSFYCSYCWVESNCIADCNFRRLTVKVNRNIKPEKYILVVDYRDCPACLAGLPSSTI
jgi:hypothetical protein